MRLKSCIILKNSNGLSKLTHKNLIADVFHSSSYSYIWKWKKMSYDKCSILGTPPELRYTVNTVSLLPITSGENYKYA